jgi:hypothetical protein
MDQQTTFERHLSHVRNGDQAAALKVAMQPIDGIERFPILHTLEVTGSSPVAPTIYYQQLTKIRSTEIGSFGYGDPLLIPNFRRRYQNLQSGLEP